MSVGPAPSSGPAKRARTVSPEGVRRKKPAAAGGDVAEGGKGGRKEKGSKGEKKRKKSNEAAAAAQGLVEGREARKGSGKRGLQKVGALNLPFCKSDLFAAMSLSSDANHQPFSVSFTLLSDTKNGGVKEICLGCISFCFFECLFPA